MQKPFYAVVREARRAANVRQSELASKVGCTQSALSMFEGGKAGVIARDTVSKIAGALGLELPAGFDGGEGTSGNGVAGAGVSGAVDLFPGSSRIVRPVVFCPDFKCLSNLPYTVGGEVLFMPLGTAGSGVRCAICGEILESACPACGKKVAKAGGCCGESGTPLVQWPDGFAEDAVAWVAAQRAAISDFLRFVRPE